MNALWLDIHRQMVVYSHRREVSCVECELAELGLNSWRVT